MIARACGEPLPQSLNHKENDTKMQSGTTPLKLSAANATAAITKLPRQLQPAMLTDQSMCLY